MPMIETVDDIVLEVTRVRVNGVRDGRVFDNAIGVIVDFDREYAWNPERQDYESYGTINDIQVFFSREECQRVRLDFPEEDDGLYWWINPNLVVEVNPSLIKKSAPPKVWPPTAARRERYSNTRKEIL